MCVEISTKIKIVLKKGIKFMLVRNGKIVSKEQINTFAVELMYPLEYFLDCIKGDARIPVGQTIEGMTNHISKIVTIIDGILDDADYTPECFDKDTLKNLMHYSGIVFGDYRVVKHENGVDITLMRNGDIAYCVEYSRYFSTVNSDVSITIEKEVSNILVEENALVKWDGEDIFETVVTITANGVVTSDYKHLSDKEKDLFIENIAICEGAEFYHEGMFTFTS